VIVKLTASSSWCSIMVIVVVLDHEGLLAAFRMPGHGAAGETPSAGLIERQGRD